MNDVNQSLSLVQSQSTSAGTSVKIHRPTIWKSSKGCMLTGSSHLLLDSRAKQVGGCTSWRQKSLEKSNSSNS